MNLRLASMRRFAAATFVAWSLGAGPVSAGAPPPLPSLFGGAFELTDHQGTAVTDKTYRGRFMLIYFGYTYCPDICPTDLATISDVIDTLGSDADNVQPIFVSIDPGRDTPEILKDHVSHFHPRLIGLTGTEPQVRSVAKVYRVHRSKVLPAGAAEDEYLVNHTPNTYLMGPDGKFLTLFPHDSKADFMTTTIRKYLNRKAG